MNAVFMKGYSNKEYLNKVRGAFKQPWVWDYGADYRKRVSVQAAVFALCFEETDKWAGRTGYIPMLNLITINQWYIVT